MENTDYNAKCAKCGYIFEADKSSDKCSCPLCGEENDTKQALSRFEEKFKDYMPKKRTTLRMVLDLVIFGLSFSALIFIIYFLVSFIIYFGK